MYYIKKINLENLRSVNVFECELQADKSYQLTGKNGAGKSTVIDAIMLALAGASGLRETRGKEYPLANVIMEGKDRAEVTLIVGSIERTLTINRTITRGEDGQVSTRLKITSNDGKELNATAVKKLLCELTIDPLAFSKNTPREQCQKLSPLLGDKLLELDAQEEALEQKRHGLAVELDRLYAVDKERVAKGISPVESKDATAIQAELDEMNKQKDRHYASIQEARKATEIYNQKADLVNINAAWVSDREQDIKEIENDIMAMQEKIEKSRQEIIVRRGNITEKEEQNRIINDELPMLKTQEEEAKKAIVPMPDDNAVKAKLADIERIMKDAALYKHYKDNQDVLEARKAERDLIVDKRNAIRIEKGELLNSLEIGRNLSWGSKTGLVVDGRPLHEMSTGEKVELSAMLAAKLATAGEYIKIMFIREGSLLDDSHLGSLVKIATDHGMQVLVEIVDTMDEVNISEIINDNEIIDNTQQELI